MQEKGWMNEDLMKVWFQEVWEKHVKSDKRSSLVLDSFEGHKTEFIKEKCKQMNIDLAIIPGGLTSLVQPLDVCLNEPFKDRMRKKWQNWMANKEYSFTKGGNLQRPGYDLICKWILEVWDDISIETVCNSFKKCKIVKDV
ncbi:2000_t:CDS:1 [Funneliformis geosporum]|nr:2000_t:CDS:1 [Funneliformis geosporum]